ncbi:MAG: protein kinase [Myxococcales bacterium]
MRNSSPVATGQIIANKYVVERVLGEGGMGVVIAAWHTGLDQRVAIKLLLRERLQHDESAIERFQREARAAARIRSQHVCRVLDTGALDDGTPFLVMEYLEGMDLADELAQRGKLPAVEAVRIVREACEALSEAHGCGIVHRDLKPANLFMVQRPDGGRLLKVLDFGVSKSLSSSGTPHRTLTKTASLVGSPIYMSPEQLNSSRDVDGRTDIWALGIILYELLTGRTPFYGETIPQLVTAVLTTEAEPLSSLGLNLPVGLEGIVMRALKKSRDERYASAQEFSQALLPFAPTPQVSVSRTVKVSSHPPPPRQSHQSASAPHEASVRVPSGAQLDAPPGWSRRRWALLVLLLVAGAGLSAALSRRLAGGARDTGNAALTIGADAGTRNVGQPPVPPLPSVASGDAPVPSTSLLKPVGNDALGEPKPSSEPVAAVPSEVPPAQVAADPSPAPKVPRTRPKPSSEPAPARPSGVPGPEASGKIPQETGSPHGISDFGGRR